MSLHVVTGASAGIGRAVTLALAARHHEVIAVARSEGPLGELAAGEAGVVPVTADVTTGGGRDRVVGACDGRPVASLVHGAASTVPVTAWSELDPLELVGHFAVHVAAPIALTNHLATEVPLERTVLLDSYAATTPRAGWSAYSMMKAAAQVAFRAAETELASTRVLRVFPGAVDTALLRAVLDAGPGAGVTAFYREVAAEGRLSPPDEIGRQLVELIEADDDTLDACVGPDGSWSIGHAVAPDRD